MSDTPRYRTRYHRITNALVCVFFLVLAVALGRSAHGTLREAEADAALRRDGTAVLARVTGLRAMASDETALGNASAALQYEFRAKRGFVQAELRFAKPPTAAPGDTFTVWFDPAEPSRHVADLGGSIDQLDAGNATRMGVGAVACLLIALGFAISQGVLRGQRSAPDATDAATATARGGATTRRELNANLVLDRPAFDDTVRDLDPTVTDATDADVQAHDDDDDDDEDDWDASREDLDDARHPGRK